MNNNAEELIATLISCLEQTESIKIFFAVETGSKSIGYDTPNSDHDLKGLFIDESFKTKLKLFSREEERIAGKTILKNGVKVDYEFLDLKWFLKKVAASNKFDRIFWFFSPIRYKNDLEWFSSLIRKKAKIPIHVFKGKLSEILAVRFRQETVEIKRILHCIWLSVFIFWTLKCDNEIEVNLEKLFEKIEQEDTKIKLNFGEKDLEKISMLKKEYFVFRELRRSDYKSTIRKDDIRPDLMDFFKEQVESAKNKGKLPDDITQDHAEMEALYYQILQELKFWC